MGCAERGGHTFSISQAQIKVVCASAHSRSVLTRGEKTCWSRNVFETPRVLSATDEIGTAAGGCSTTVPTLSVWGFIISFIARPSPSTHCSSHFLGALGIRGDREEPVGPIHALHCHALTAGSLRQRSVSPVDVE
jgi:hypothetical protein